MKNWKAIADDLAEALDEVYQFFPCRGCDCNSGTVAECEKERSCPLAENWRRINGLAHDALKRHLEAMNKHTVAHVIAEGEKTAVHPDVPPIEVNLTTVNGSTVEVFRISPDGELTAGLLKDYTDVMDAAIQDDVDLLRAAWLGGQEATRDRVDALNAKIEKIQSENAGLAYRVTQTQLTSELGVVEGTCEAAIAEAEERWKQEIIKLTDLLAPTVEAAFKVHQDQHEAEESRDSHELNTAVQKLKVMVADEMAKHVDSEHGLGVRGMERMNVQILAHDTCREVLDEHEKKRHQAINEIIWRGTMNEVAEQTVSKHETELRRSLIHLANSNSADIGKKFQQKIEELTELLAPVIDAKFTAHQKEHATQKEVNRVMIQQAMESTLATAHADYSRHWHAVDLGERGVLRMEAQGVAEEKAREVMREHIRTRHDPYGLGVMTHIDICESCIVKACSERGQGKVVCIKCDEGHPE